MKRFISHSFLSFISRYSRHIGPKLIGIKRYQTGILLGVVVSLAGLMMFQESQGRESHQIFKQDGHLDFKNASILGNPSRVILEKEESNLSKTQRAVLESQAQLKKEVETLKAALSEIRGGSLGIPHVMASGQPEPTPSVSPQVEGVFGPMPLPSSQVGLNTGHAQKGEEFTHTRVSDQLLTHAAAPRSVSRSRVFTEVGPIQKEKKAGSSMISFPVKASGKVFLKKPSIVLPSGSYVKAMLLTGVEAPEGKTYPVLLQLDYAYVIPNEKRLDLAGCFIIAKAQGDLSTERVQMQASKLSCVSRKGGMFEREVNGFVADNVDNSFAVMGRVNSKQDRVAANSFLASIVSGIGKAIQQAQTTQQTTPLGGSQSVITGDQAKYIGAGGASEAASQVTQWYLKQAQNLLPTINVGSGQEVWIVMQDQVDLPKDYFTQNNFGGISNASIYSYFTRIVD